MLNNTKIKVVWSDQAKADLKYIHKRILNKTKSPANSQNVKRDIIQASKQIDFVNQYQVDEFLGKPYRRMIVRHFKIVYVPDSKSSIIVLQIFDTYRHPNKMKNNI